MAKYDGIIEDFESLSELGVFEKDEGIRLVHYPEQGRIGVFASSGVKFSTPEELFEHATLKRVLDEVRSGGRFYDASKQTVPPCPRLAHSNASVLKRLQMVGYPTVSTFVRFLSQKVSREQMSLLSNFVVRDLISKGQLKLNLTLKRNTNYYQTKARKLSALQDGGQWEFWGLNYVIDGSKCTMGHNINWEFIAHEKELDEYIVFGATCVQDFFNVDNQVLSQLSTFKGYVLNEMLEYAFNLGVAQGYHFQIVKWQAYFLELAVSKGWVSDDAHSRRLVHTVKTFADAHMLLPMSLQENVSALFGQVKVFEKAQSFFSQAGYKWSLLCALGIFGNGYLDMSTVTAYKRASQTSHLAGTLGMLGTLVHKDEFPRAVIARFKLLGASHSAFQKAMFEVLALLNNVGSVKGFDSLLHNLATFDKTLAESNLKVRYSMSDGSKIIDILYKGRDKFTCTFEDSRYKFNEFLNGYPYLPIPRDDLAVRLVDKVRGLGEVEQARLQAEREQESLKVREYKNKVKAENDALTFLPVNLEQADKFTDLAGFKEIVKSYKNGTYERSDSKVRGDFDSEENWSRWVEHLDNSDKLFVLPSREFESFNYWRITMATLSVLYAVFSGLAELGYPELAICANVCLEIKPRLVASDSQRDILSAGIQRVFELHGHGVVLKDSKVYNYFLTHQSKG